MSLPSADRETLVASRRPLRPGGMAEVLRLAAPTMAAFATTVVMNLTDTIMVAGVGPGAVGSVATSGILFHAVTAFFGGLTAAITTFVSQGYGRGDPHDGARYSWQGVYIAVVVGSLAFAIVPLLPALFALLGHTDAMQAMETSYSRFRVASLGFILLGFSLRNFFQGTGRTKLILAVTIVANALNVLMNWVLIFGVGPFPRMGVAGAGLATLLSTVVLTGLYVVPFLWSRAAREARTRHAAGFSWPRLKGLLRIGIPTSWQWSLDVLAWGLWHAVLIGRLGPAALDANGAVMEIMSAAWFPVIGLGQAASSLVGWYLGRGRPDRVRRAARSAMTLAVAYMGLISLVFIFSAEHLIGGFFRLQAEHVAAADLAAVVALGTAALRIAALWQVFDGICITLMGALRGAGDTLWPAVVQQLLTWLLFLPLALVLCFVAEWGMPGAWWAGVIHLGLLATVLLVRYRGTAWMGKNIFRDREESDLAG